MYNPDINPFPPELASDNPAPPLDPGTFVRQLNKEKRDIADRKRKRNKKVKAIRQKRKHKRRG